MSLDSENCFTNTGHQHPEDSEQGVPCWVLAGLCLKSAASSEHRTHLRGQGFPLRECQLCGAIPKRGWTALCHRHAQCPMPGVALSLRLSVIPPSHMAAPNSLSHVPTCAPGRSFSWTQSSRSWDGSLAPKASLSRCQMPAINRTTPVSVCFWTTLGCATGFPRGIWKLHQFCCGPLDWKDNAFKAPVNVPRTQGTAANTGRA